MSFTANSASSIGANVESTPTAPSSMSWSSAEIATLKSSSRLSRCSARLSLTSSGPVNGFVRPVVRLRGARLALLPHQMSVGATPQPL